MTEKTAMYECLTEFREPLLRPLIRGLNLPPGSRGLDAGCAVGRITRWLSEAAAPDGRVTGLDLSEEFIAYAEKTIRAPGLDFIQADYRSLPYDECTFDWIWSADALWPAENPGGILKEFNRVLRPGGTLILLYWSSQKLLPGYPLLEARLNTTSSATAPYREEMNPEHHIFNGRLWLRQAGFRSLSAATFPGDISAPFGGNDRKALNYLFAMLWEESVDEMTAADRKKYRRLCLPGSPESVLNNVDYYGFYTYTVLKGVK